MNRILETKVDKRLVWYCPGCKSNHQVPVALMNSAGNAASLWSWNGSTDRPTLNPSVLVHYGDTPPPDRPAKCHCYVRDGRIQFLGDCDHELAGQTVDMVDEPA